MRSVFTRREWLPAALAAVLAPLSAWRRPAWAIPDPVCAGATRLPMTTTYRYDDRGRLLSVRGSPPTIPSGERSDYACSLGATSWPAAGKHAGRAPTAADRAGRPDRPACG